MGRKLAAHVYLHSRCQIALLHAQSCRARLCVVNHSGFGNTLKLPPIVPRGNRHGSRADYPDQQIEYSLTKFLARYSALNIAAKPIAANRAAGGSARLVSNIGTFAPNTMPAA